MKKLQVVLGANYGDEGKGRITDHLSATRGAAVVRFNGGAQAGHTVVTNGYRHVFSHYGSGSFNYAPTILTSDFVCSPYLFKKENEQLVRKGVIRPDMYVSPYCPVTTPWDVVVNQLSEMSRGSERHGSVGVGFGETIERHNNFNYRLTVEDLLLPKDAFLMKMYQIFTTYISSRLVNIGFDFKFDNAQWALEMIRNPENVHMQFYQECQYFLDRVTVLDESDALNNFEHLIFEGAQGLALDQQSPDFPHVTRSFTGIDNVLRACNAAGITDPFELYYITRPYLTRHGAGPLKNEVEKLEHFDVVDETNKPHDFQGSLRFATHNVDDMVARIIKDQFKIPKPQIGKIIGVITCLDQVSNEDGNFTATIDGKEYKVDGNSFAQVFGDRISAAEMILCHGEEEWAMNHMYRGNKDGA